MKCLCCGDPINLADTTPNNRRKKKYCSVTCQKAAHQKRWYQRFRDAGGFQWHNPKWMPTALEDRIWARTGIESVKEYLQHRYKWLKASEIALEINTNESEIRNLLARYGLKQEDTEWDKMRFRSITTTWADVEGRR